MIVVNSKIVINSIGAWQVYLFKSFILVLINSVSQECVKNLFHYWHIIMSIFFLNCTIQSNKILKAEDILKLKCFSKLFSISPTDMRLSSENSRGKNIQKKKHFFLFFIECRKQFKNDEAWFSTGILWHDKFSWMALLWNVKVFFEHQAYHWLCFWCNHLYFQEVWPIPCKMLLADDYFSINCQFHLCL